jgi:hypothetical protein
LKVQRYFCPDTAGTGGDVPNGTAAAMLCRWRGVEQGLYQKHRSHGAFPSNFFHDGRFHRGRARRIDNFVGLFKAEGHPLVNGYAENTLCCLRREAMKAKSNVLRKNTFNTSFSTKAQKNIEEKGCLRERNGALLDQKH